MLTPSPYRVRSPLFPDYTTVRHLLRIWNGEPRENVLRMITKISDQTGTPQDPVDWSEPDKWINERLKGPLAELAMRMWRESDHYVNPRHSYGTYLFVNTFELLATDPGGVYRLTENGRLFLDGDPAITRELDEQEGVLHLLSLLAARPSAKRGDLLGEWGEYLHKYSKFGTESTIKDTLRRRLVNLLERGLVDRDGMAYAINEAGKKHMGAVRPKEKDPKQDITRAIQHFNADQRERLKETLAHMDPKKFEELVGALLDAMDYQDVVVTKVSGDMGIDVVGKAQFGITTVTEVVQVKRKKDKVRRPILDQLRGSLPYYNAIRGTIITVSDFTKDCVEAALFPNAAPITLINGDELIRMLVEHGIGVKKTQLELEEVDETYFVTLQEREGEL
ncbi:MAG: restriction endonuclease [Myxococcales bacterium]|nr:MAG: restriction endonuclease [Myxococcales bacterium]